MKIMNFIKQLFCSHWNWVHTETNAVTDFRGYSANNKFECICCGKVKWYRYEQRPVNLCTDEQVFLEFKDRYSGI